MSPQHLANAELRTEVVRREKAFRAGAAEQLALIAELDRRRGFEDEGFLSTTSWLRDRCRFSNSEAQRWVELARRLADLPDVVQALAEGDISLDHARLLAAASADHPDHFEDDHKVLIDAARELSPSNLRKALDYWRQAHDADATDAEHERRFERRRLHASVTLGGMVRLDGDLDPEGGALVLTALRAKAEPWALEPNDHRSAPQRLADALVEMCGDFLDAGEAPLSGG
ncbi:MAG: 13E12 repeat family protein, partial [Acidimicrobiia bacterium]|nr:13E12 repeat family protein [Acidimicrobiia bacterium]